MEFQNYTKTHSKHSNGNNFKNYRTSKKEHYSNFVSTNSNQKFVIQVNTEKIGKLIGKSGSNIRELQDKTKTKIHVSIN